jgi:hypothetical protein
VAVFGGWVAFEIDLAGDQADAHDASLHVVFIRFIFCGSKNILGRKKGKEE